MLQRLGFLGVLSAFAALGAAHAWAAPVNDDCANAIPVLSGVELTGSTEDATGTEVSACSQDDFFDVWHTYTAAADEPVDISLCGSGFDTTLSVYDACGGALIECNDDSFGCGAQSEVRCLALTSGQTVYIRIAGYQGQTGSYTLNVAPCTPVANDACASAAPLALNTLVEGDTVSSTGTGLTAPCSSNDFRDVWYSYTPAANQTVSVSLCGSYFDTTLSVFDACGGTAVACGEDNGICGNPYNSFIGGLGLTGGTTYYVRVAGYNNQSGPYQLILFDNSPPQVLEIRSSSASPTNTTAFAFYVYFDRPVLGFDDVSDLVITATGVTYDSMFIAPSDDAYDVGFEGLAGDGQLSIAISTASDVRSVDNVPLASSISSEVITFDYTAPVINGVTVTPDTARPGEEIQIEIDTDEPLGYAAVDVNGSPAAPAKSGVTFVYEVSESDPEGPAAIDVYVEDLVGNPATVTNNALLTIEPLNSVPLPALPLGLALVAAGVAALRRRGR